MTPEQFVNALRSSVLEAAARDAIGLLERQI